MGKFVISIRKDGEIQFSLRAANGEIILLSQGYTVKDTCKKGIESVQRNALQDNKFARHTSADGKVYFTMKARNGKVIGTSEMYETKAAMEAGIKSVQSNAPGAVTEDQSDS